MAAWGVEQGDLGGVPLLDCELDGVEGRVEEMDVAEVGGDDEVAVGPRGILVSADEEFKGELFEDVIVSGVEFVAG